MGLLGKIKRFFLKDNEEYEYDGEWSDAGLSRSEERRVGKECM